MPPSKLAIRASVLGPKPLNSPGQELSNVFSAVPGDQSEAFFVQINSLSFVALENLCSIQVRYSVLFDTVDTLYRSSIHCIAATKSIGLHVKLLQVHAQAKRKKKHLPRGSNPRPRA